MIEGVEFKQLITHSDERGLFRELIRSTDTFFQAGFGQLSHSLVHTGIVKAWHGHLKQTQWNYVVTGLIKVALYDDRAGSTTHGGLMECLVGEHQPKQVYSFPPGVLHGYKCISGPMNIIYVTSGTYETDEEIRIAPDATHIDYDWLSQPIH